MLAGGGTIAFASGLGVLNNEILCVDATCTGAANISGLRSFRAGGTVSSVPEPAAWSLMLIGALALVGRARLQTLRRRHPNSPSR